jgi:23S rRNA pseudouridine2457 synthase
MLNKPYNMVSQFVSSHPVPLLGDLEFNFPEGIHAIGRLDKPSEGLLLLTTNTKITKLLFESKIPHQRSYLVMARGKVSDEKIEQLTNGVSILLRDNKGDFITTPCLVKRIIDPKEIYSYAVDFREAYDHTWLLMTLTEGKFRQVRKMLLSIGHACMRLIRVSIGDLQLNHLPPSGVKEIEEQELCQLLNIVL